MPPIEAATGISKQPATFQCSLCPKRFTRAFNLHGHLRTHTNERPFACAICGRRFVRKNDEKTHMLIHTKEKKFVCKGKLANGQYWGCERSFALAKNLGRHFRSEKGRLCIKPLLDEEDEERAKRQAARTPVHKEKKFVCKGDLASGEEWGCGRRFVSARNLGRHFRSEKGRLCIKPLLDEEMSKRHAAWLAEHASTAPPTLDEALKAADTVRHYIRHHGQLNTEENGLQGYLELNFRAMTVQTPSQESFFLSGILASQNQEMGQLLYPNMTFDGLSWAM